MKWHVVSTRVYADNCDCGLTHDYFWRCGVIGTTVSGRGLTRQDAIKAAEIKLKEWCAREKSKFTEAEFGEVETP